MALRKALKKLIRRESGRGVESNSRDEEVGGKRKDNERKEQIIW